MLFREMKMYIAAPFFNEKQLNIVKEIETKLDEFGIKYYSPRSEGTLSNQTPEERKANLKRIYDSNIRNMHRSNVIIAVMDDRDIGTIFELGYFAAKKAAPIISEQLILTFTNEDYGLNVMIQQTVDAHLKGISRLHALLFEIARTPKDEIDSSILNLFKDFDEGKVI